jgi:hypothetical protein
VSPPAAEKSSCATGPRFALPLLPPLLPERPRRDARPLPAGKACGSEISGMGVELGSHTVSPFQATYLQTANPRHTYEERACRSLSDGIQDRERNKLKTQKKKT